MRRSARAYQAIHQGTTVATATDLFVHLAEIVQRRCLVVFVLRTDECQGTLIVCDSVIQRASS